MSESTNSELEAYRRDGFVVPEYRLPLPALKKLQDLTMELVNAFPDRKDKTFPSPHVDYNGKTRLNIPHRKEWMEVATDPGILDVMENIIGPDLILWTSALFYKRAEGGPATPWHRDGPHWPIKPIATTSVWVSVFDSKKDNGCLRCIPGSNHSKEWGRHFHTIGPGVIAPITIDPSEYDEGTARDIELESGQMVLFDIRTIHGARHNLGARPRAGYTIRFMPATSHYDHDMTKARRESDEQYERKAHDKDYASRPLFLVRGVDKSGLNDFKRNHLATAGA